MLGLITLVAKEGHLAMMTVVDFAREYVNLQVISAAHDVIHLVATEGLPVYFGF